MTFKFQAIIPVIILLLSLSCSHKNKIIEKPDIILINIDDMGWRDVGFMGSEYYETPEIDDLASKGTVFTQAYASASNCAPSRACMMTGQWTPRHGIYTVNNSDRGKSKNRKIIPVRNETILPDTFYILVEALKDAGYFTIHAGKWHLNSDPCTQGFDINIGGCEAGNPGSYYPPYTRVPIDAPAEDKYLTELIMDMVIENIESAKDDPLFLYYSPYAVHTPIHPVEALLPKYKERDEWNGQNHAGYATMIENLDVQIGRLIDALETTGRLENCFIIFTSDNGGVYNITKQWPLRAGKGSYYEGGLREPMFIYWPGKVKAGVECNVPVTNIDFFPTILEVAGIETPSSINLDGTSIVSLFTDQDNFTNRALFWHFPIYLEGGNIETQDPAFRTRPGSAIRLGDWKLIEYFENGDMELYNLKDDIGEKNNLAETEPEKLQELLMVLSDWRNNVNAPVPDKLNAGYIER